MSKSFTNQVRSRIIGTLKEGIPKRPQLQRLRQEVTPTQKRIKQRKQRERYAEQQK